MLRTFGLMALAVLFGLVVKQAGIVQDGQLTYVAVGIMSLGVVVWLWQR